MLVSMAFLNLFRRRSNAPEELGLEDVSAWVSRELRKKGGEAILANLNKSAEKIQKGLQTKIEQLDAAELLNKNIPERAKQVMMGNREQYIFLIKQFFENEPWPEDALKLDSYAQALGMRLTRLEEKTRKNFYILKEFVESDVRAIASDLKAIEDAAIKATQNMEKLGIYDLRTIQQKVKALQGLDDEKLELKEELVSVENSLKDAKQKVKKFKARINEIKKSNAYVHFIAQQNRLETLRKKQISAKEEVQKMWAKIDKPAKKYAYDSKAKLLQTYCDDAVQALIQDANLDVMVLIDEMKGFVKTENAKDSQKMLKNLEEIKEEKLARVRSDLCGAQEKIDELESMLKSNMAKWSLQEQEELLKSANVAVTEQEKARVFAQERVENVRPSILVGELKRLLEVQNARLIYDEGSAKEV